MAETTAAQIMSFQGNPALGVGASPSAIREVGIADTPETNDVFKNILLQDHQNNIELYKQKVADRDKQLEALKLGNVQVGKVREHDRPIVQDLIDKVGQVWRDAKGDIIHNPDNYAKYTKAIQEANDAATWAQQRYLDDATVRSDGAKITNPYLRPHFDKFYADQSKKVDNDFFSSFQPYVPAFNIDPELLKGKLVKKTIEDKDVNPKGFDKYTSYEVADPVATAANITKDYLAPNGAASYDKTRQHIADDPNLQQTINRGLAERAKEYGYDPANVASLPKILQPFSPLDNSIDAVTKQIIAATPKVEKYDDKRAKEDHEYQLGKARIAVAKQNAETARRRQQAQSAYANWKMSDPQVVTNIDAMYNTMLGQITLPTGATPEQVKSELITAGGNIHDNDYYTPNKLKGADFDYVPMANLAPEYRNMMGVTSNDKGKIILAQADPFVDPQTGVNYVKVNYYDQQTNAPIPTETVRQFYQKAVEKSKKKNQTLTYAQFISANQNKIGVDWSAQNGPIDKNTMGQSARFINNEASRRKGQEAIFGQQQLGGGQLEGVSVGDSNSSVGAEPAPAIEATETPDENANPNPNPE